MTKVKKNINIRVKNRIKELINRIAILLLLIADITPNVWELGLRLCSRKDIMKIVSSLWRTRLS